MTEEESMTRELTVEATATDNTLRLREQFATAEHGEATLSWTHGFGFGDARITVDVKLPDGSRVSESIHIQPLLMEWAKQILNENGVH